MKNTNLTELDFADLSQEDLQALKNAEEVINRARDKKIFLMAICRD